MVELDRVWRQARADLVIATESGENDPFLYEHAHRVAVGASAILSLGAVRACNPDETAVVVAALYHDSAWSLRVVGGDVRREEILVRPPADSHREQSAAFMERKLATLVPAESLRRAYEAVRTMGDKDHATVEGQIVSDADNLDDFGPLALWPAIRRGVLDGKGVQAAIDTWRRRIEYQFWSARLSDSFHFNEVRKLAEARLADYERMMQALSRHHQSKDVLSACGVSLSIKDQSPT